MSAAAPNQKQAWAPFPCDKSITIEVDQKNACTEVSYLVGVPNGFSPLLMRLSIESKAAFDATKQCGAFRIHVGKRECVLTFQTDRGHTTWNANYNSGLACLDVDVPSVRYRFDGVDDQTKLGKWTYIEALSAFEWTQRMVVRHTQDGKEKHPRVPGQRTNFLLPTGGGKMGLMRLQFSDEARAAYQELFVHKDFCLWMGDPSTAVAMSANGQHSSWDATVDVATGKIIIGQISKTLKFEGFDADKGGQVWTHLDASKRQ